MADDRRQQMAEDVWDALVGVADYLPRDASRRDIAKSMLPALLPLLDRVAADAAAEAMEEFADEQDSSTNHQCDAPYWARDLAERSRARAAELRAPARTDEEN